MPAPYDRRRVLIVAVDAERRPLRELFAFELLEEWEALEADSFQQARFVVQHDGCDVLLIDEGVYRREDNAGLSWLAAQQRAPVVFLSGPTPDVVADALEHGANQWLPRELALTHPPLLAASLSQAAHLGDVRRRGRLAGEALHECRRQVSRLVGLLWEASPIDSRTRWFTQRHMLERLNEEVARAGRHGTLLSVVLGEVRAPDEGAPLRETPHLAAWTADRIARVKRRADVVGQYGTNGFMLLLGHTSEAGAATCCNRIRTLLQETPPPTTGLHGPVQAHFGIASYSPETATPHGLLSRAEERLEVAKTGTADTPSV